MSYHHHQNNLLTDSGAPAIRLLVPQRQDHQLRHKEDKSLFWSGWASPHYDHDFPILATIYQHLFDYDNNDSDDDDNDNDYDDDDSDAGNQARTHRRPAVDNDDDVNDDSDDDDDDSDDRTRREHEEDEQPTCDRICPKVWQRQLYLQVRICSWQSWWRQWWWCPNSFEDGKIPTKKVKAKVCHRENVKFKLSRLSLFSSDFSIWNQQKATLYVDDNDDGVRGGVAWTSLTMVFGWHFDF